ncbi:Cryptochrome DASH [Planctomycetes bacterium Poly30]|uniref:Cryptochrome DASH n=1 Tax=Saltatorellus ferox TaxID=2528018 RepID=A0A518EKZ3_9BACT|nr:Cryptochrome DASH [Planctomycetes bacterium Poly30]
MNENGSGPVAVWFRQDLRVSDHPALLAAAAEARRAETSLVGVYCFDEREFGWTPRLGCPRTGAFRARFLLEALDELRASLRRLGSDLIVRRGSPARLLVELARANGWSALHLHGLVGTEEHLVEASVKLGLEEIGVTLQEHHDRTLHDAYPFPLEEVPEVFSSFRKIVEREGTIAKPLEAPARLPGRPTLDPEPIPTLADLGLEDPTDDPRAVMRFRGGESAGQSRLKAFVDGGHLATYKETRNGLVALNDSSKLSPWLALGCVSCRMVQAAVAAYEESEGANESTYWMTFELLWRDYFQLIVQKHGAAVFQSGGIQRFPVRWKHDEAALSPVRLDVGAVNSTQRFESPLGLNVHFHSLYLDGVYVTRSAFESPVFLPADPLTSAEVERVHGDAIERIRRVLKRYSLDPIALGLPLRKGDEPLGSTRTRALMSSRSSILATRVMMRSFRP